jgi:elongation factor G
VDDIARLRNIAIVGPHHAGKTTLVEALLAHCGAIPRRGSVRDGTTITDCEPEAIGHLQSVCVGFAHTSCGPVDITFVDTPGFVDYFEETKTVLAAVDAALIVIDGEPGRVAQTAAIVDHVEMRKMPHLFFVNKLDRPGANFDATLAALRDAYGPHVVATHLPVGVGEKFGGYVDLATRKTVLNADGRTSEIAVPIALRDTVEAQRTILLEALADFDDTLMEELLDGKDPAQDEIERDLCEDCSHDQIVPVLVGSAQENIGVGPLIDAIARLFPSPVTEPRHDVDGRAIVPRADGPKESSRSCACSPARSRRRRRSSTHRATTRRSACRGSRGCSAKSKNRSRRPAPARSSRWRGSTACAPATRSRRRTPAC